MYSFKFYKQDVTLYNIPYCCQVSANSTTLAVAASKPDIYQMLCVQFELLMMGGKTARNMYSLDSNKEYCITLHFVGYT